MNFFCCKPCFISKWIFLISRLDFFKLDFLYFKIGFSGFRRHPTGAHVETHSRHPTGVERNRLESSNGGPRSPTICRASSRLASPAPPATAASIVPILNWSGISSCEHFVQKRFSDWMFLYSKLDYLRLDCPPIGLKL